MNGMKSLGIRVLLTALVTILLAGTAPAENRPGAVTVSPFIGQIFFDDSLDHNNSGILGLSVGYNLSKAIALEISFARADTKEDQENRNFEYANVDFYRLEGLYHFKELTPNLKIIPFIAAGGGLVRFDSERPGTGTSTDWAVDAGAGVKYYLNQGLALRADVREVASFARGESYFSLLYGVGAVLAFGGQAETKVAEASKETPPAAETPQEAQETPIVPVKQAEPADSDKDGVADDMDKCPGTPKGVAVDKDGCPPDTDGDGVPDYLDRCQNTPKGVKVDNYGCPVPEKAVITDQGTHNFGPVYFDFGKATVSGGSNETLDEVVKYMKAYPDVKYEIQGHTDSVGSKRYNLKLSQKRAGAVLSYLVERGIAAERIKAKGYGFSTPVASNRSKQGRAKNRRTEFLPLP